MSKPLELTAMSHADFESIKERFNTEKFIFRGLPDKSYRLIPSLYRGIFDHEDDVEYIARIFYKEDDIFKMIEKYECQGEKLTLSHLCKLQHYGVETRLLDFTKDINIALTFAICDFYDEEFINNDKDAAIVVLDKTQFMPKHHDDEELLAQLIYDYNEEDCGYIEMDDRMAEYPLKPIYYEYDGEELDRVVKQKGCFILFPHAFEDNLEIKEDIIYAKIIIPKEVKQELYNHLLVKIRDLK